MKTLLALLAFTLFTSQAMAQKIVYACQFTNSAGLIKENNSWRATPFIPDKPFFLTEENGSLTTESISKVLSSPIDYVLCADTLRQNSKLRSCINGWGSSIYLNTGSLNGAVSTLVAAGFPNERPIKDSNGDGVWISTFTCTKM
jgi:hypothetical protein